MNNFDIRSKIGFYNLKLWEVARQLGISDSSFSRMLREELPEEKKTKIYEAIDCLRKDKYDKNKSKNN